MADFLSRLVARSTAPPNAAQPRQRPVYEPVRAEPLDHTRPDSDEWPGEWLERARVRAHETAPYRNPLEPWREPRAGQAIAPYTPDDAPAPRATRAAAADQAEPGRPRGTAENEPRAVAPDSGAARSAQRSGLAQPAAPRGAPEETALPAPAVPAPLPAPAANAVLPSDDARRRAPSSGPLLPAPRPHQPGRISPRISVAEAQVRAGDDAVSSRRNRGAAEAPSASAPMVHINIGRIEVRAVRETEKPAEKRALQPRLTLEEYQRERRTGKR
jgi:hypothetical protein